MPTTRRLAIALMLLTWLAAAWPLLARGQVLELTPDTACGARGVGLVREWLRPGVGWRAEARPGTPGQYVGRDGRWHTGCKMPPKPPACPARPTYQWADQTSGALCTPSTPEIRAVDEIGRMRQVHAIGRGGAIVGRATYECTATGWALVAADTYCRGR
ncbi:MAG: hypothetical protein KA774_09860 [Burkholderiaceae bacterium]|nr:hypothetical protein [Burkholderiaceae bacterium]